MTGWLIERQVRLVAGVLVLTGLALSRACDPRWIWLTGFVGGGLVVAGVTDFCLMGRLLRLLPFNKSKPPCA